MISARWIKKRQPYWGRLEQLIESARVRGVSAFKHKELQELGLLYRQTASDLSTVREDPSSAALAVYLNQLLARAHNLVYMSRRVRPRGILHFYRETFPQVFRATLPYTATAFVLFLSAAIAGFLTCLQDGSFSRYLLGAHMVDTIERREMWTHSILALKPLASSAILTNNMGVCFTVFALGITAGVGTALVIVLNGLLLGVIAAACLQAGMNLSLWSFVAPHGILELPAVFIAGGAGLLLARGILFPGLLPRRESLNLAGAQGVRLLLGTIPLLVAAGFIEGFVSPSELHASIKFLFATILGGILALYLLRTGRSGQLP